MSTYLVAFFPDATLNVAAVGPFRSQAKAVEVRDRLEKVLDPPEADGWDEWAYRRPHVVTCMSEAQAVERYGIETEEG